MLPDRPTSSGSSGTRRTGRRLFAAFALLALALLCGPRVEAATAAPAPTASAGFEAANRSYSAGDYKAARAGYEAMVRSGSWSANLFYNLGNADYRLDDKGAAFVAYERALALDPSHPEARANLNLLRDETGARVRSRSWWEKGLAWPNEATRNNAAWMAAAAFWVVVICLLPALWKRRAAWLPAGLALLVLAWSVGAVAWKRSRGETWIVTAEQASARVAPADSSELAAALPEGSHVQLLLERGEWLYVLLPDQSRGWIARKAVEPVILTRT